MESIAILRAGLGEAEAATRLRRFGPNLLRKPHRRGFLEVTVSTLKEPMFLLLLVAAGLYLVFGDLAEGLFLLAGASLTLGLVIAQELRSERALAALNALAEPVARVVRDGRERTIAAADLVPGDVVVVGEGGRLAADGVLIAGDALQVDESALTGEAAPVSKRFAEDGFSFDDDPAPGDEVSANLFAGTIVRRGQGLALVRRIGGATRVGRIGTALGEIVERPTLVQRDIRRLIGRLGVLAIGFCVLVAILYGTLRGDWFQGALNGLTLAISLIPEEIPMVLAIFMALGAWRLARHNVLVRRSAVIETLGATTLLCVDKTGTLTENRMTLDLIWREGRSLDVREAMDNDARSVLAVARRASAVRPHDPMDMAVHGVAGPVPTAVPLRSYPLRPDFLAFVQVWPAENHGEVVYAAKGAPETVLRLCRLDGEAARAAEAAVHRLAGHGLRVLAVAEARGADPDADPESLAYRFEGLLGFADPVRDDVPPALAEARRAGVAVAMITGDFPATALAAARVAGIDAAAGLVSGSDIAAGGPTGDQLRARVFARIMPEQKLRLVEAFRASGEVVAMTGDGINDAPALAAADIGIAMGKRGTDVAREASDLILLDDRFASIVGGIRLGRRIFANLRRAMTYITAIHIPVAGLALFPMLLGLPPMLYPMHLVLLELLIDPVCSLVFEGEPSEEQAMARPPRPAMEPLFGARQIALAALQGMILLGAVLALYVSILDARGAETARAAAFVALVAGQLSLALAETGSGRGLFVRRPIFWAIAAGAAAVVGAAMTVPMLLRILRFAPPSTELLFSSLLIGFIAGGCYAVVRLGRSKRRFSTPRASAPQVETGIRHAA